MVGWLGGWAGESALNEFSFISSHPLGREKPAKWQQQKENIWRVVAEAPFFGERKTKKYCFHFKSNEKTADGSSKEKRQQSQKNQCGNGPFIPKLERPYNTSYSDKKIVHSLLKH